MLCGLQGAGKTTMAAKLGGMIKKGGKGVASTCGMAFMTAPLAALPALALFIVTVIISKYVSLGSIVGVIAFFILTIVNGQLGMIGLSGTYLIEAYIITGFLAAICVWKHRENIGRLMSGTENKFSLKKKKE